VSPWPSKLFPFDQALQAVQYAKQAKAAGQSVQGPDYQMQCEDINVLDGDWFVTVNGHPIMEEA